MYDSTLFDNVHHFSVINYRSGGSKCYQSFPEAKADAEKDEDAFLYAVTLAGRVAQLARDKWKAYLDIWTS